jgi:hypothetical protein
MRFVITDVHQHTHTKLQTGVTPLQCRKDHNLLKPFADVTHVHHKNERGHTNHNHNNNGNSVDFDETDNDDIGVVEIILK